MKIVHYAETPGEAHLVRGFLEENGIRAIVQGEALETARGGVPISRETAPTVCVADEDATRAVELIARRGTNDGGLDAETVSDI